LFPIFFNCEFKSFVVTRYFPGPPPPICRSWWQEFSQETQLERLWWKWRRRQEQLEHDRVGCFWCCADPFPRVWNPPPPRTPPPAQIHLKQRGGEHNTTTTIPRVCVDGLDTQKCVYILLVLLDRFLGLVVLFMLCLSSSVVGLHLVILWKSVSGALLWCSLVETLCGT